MANTEFIEPPDTLIGKTIGGEFTIVQKVGSGGMGAVYRAVQHVTERSVALKILHAHLLEGTFLKRFTQEARIISRLSHPNIVTIFKYGQSDDGNLYIAMEFVDGSNLADLIVPEWYFEVGRAVPLMIQMADALAYAHEKQIIHRDIKPDNMVLTKTGRTEMIKILDFGVAKILGDAYVRTKTGALCGSPPYMSPEQWQQVKDLDGRSDIYSLGCVFYRMVTGVAPFEAESTLGFMKAHLNKTPPAPLEVCKALSQLPRLSDIVIRCIRRDRDERYPDAYALLEDLKEVHQVFNSSRPHLWSGTTSSSSPPLPTFLEPTLFSGNTDEVEPPPVRQSDDESPTLTSHHDGEGPKVETIPIDEGDLLSSVTKSGSADNLPSQSSGTNLGLPPRRVSRSNSNNVIEAGRSASPAPPGSLRSLQGGSFTPSLTPDAVVTSDDEEGSTTTHLLLIAAGSVLLIFLLVSGLYFWLRGPVMAEAPPMEPSSSREGEQDDAVSNSALGNRGQSP